MKLSTSSRISLGFTLLTVLILAIFSGIIFQLFHHGRQRAEAEMLHVVPRMGEKNFQKPGNDTSQEDLRKRFLQTIVLDKNDVQAIFFTTFEGERGMKQHQDTWYMYRHIRDKIVLRDVTSHMERQQELFRLLVLGMLFAALISFFVGKGFVKRALRDLHILTKKVEDIDIERLDFGHTLDHLPDDDELVVLAHTLSLVTEKLDRQVSDIKQFVANAAHELRTPLMILRASSDVAIKTKKYKTSVLKTQVTIGHMQGLIDTLLMLARSETNGFEKENIDPVVVIAPLVDQMNQKYKEKNIHLHVQSAMTESISAHQVSFERIVHNILDNAYKYTPEDGTIEVVVEDTGLHITDTGMGITSEELKHIWQPFWQADMSRGEDTGFGLGLALVKRLVDLHEWKIEVESKKGKGTTFSILR